jgi:hypothetical protein
MRRRLAVAVGLLTLMLGAIFMTPSAHAAGVRVGVLTCNVSSGFGFVFGSSRTLNCTFSGSGGRVQHYVGTINRFGADHEPGTLRLGRRLWRRHSPSQRRCRWRGQCPRRRQ